MIERLVENWLDNVGERGFETPFAQLLTQEGHRVLQGPVHHPFEHGKDIITIAPDGAACAFQLKGPHLKRLGDFERINGQLLALVTTAISHPGIGTPRRPDRAYLVTNGVLTPPVRDRLERFNVGNGSLGYPAVEAFERDHLLSRFIAAHGTYLPQGLSDMRALIELYYAEPSTLFPVRTFAAYLTDLMPFPPAESSGPDRRRAVTSAALLTAYAAKSWTQAENHLGTAQAWLTFSATLLRFAEVYQLEETEWRTSYDLALETARASLASLSKEAAEASDVAIPDLTEGLFYPSRALLICGYLSAYWLSERTFGTVDATITDRVRLVLLRECEHTRLVGECDVPAFFELSCALGQLGNVQSAEVRMLALASTLATVNKRDSLRALPDPYHDVEQILMSWESGDSDLEGEEFAGCSYMLHVVIDWIARRLWRQGLARMWPEITTVQFLEFRPSAPDRYLAPEDDDGILTEWSAGQPQSWAALLASARTKDYSVLPPVLRQHRELIPYLPLLFPYRFTATLAAAVDALTAAPRDPTILSRPSNAAKS